MVAMLGACATPAERIDKQAKVAGFSRVVATGMQYQHVVYRNDRPGAGQALHVYIEGDGRPYLDRFAVAPDPTPRRALMLELMALDAGPAIYIGRPCYFGLAAHAPCTPLDWSLRRFSADTVASMAAVIAEEGHAAASVRIFGHSGGGTLAVLLARTLHNVTGVVTLAGNLDTAAWVRLHGYASLTGSVDPLQGGALAPSILQWHLAGERDRNIPPALIEAAAHALGDGEFRIVEDADHACCWQREWPSVLRQVAVAAENATHPVTSKRGASPQRAGYARETKPISGLGFPTGCDAGGIHR
jgi:dienelactone hydrolase